ncbi:MAG TPA: sugar-binding protein [Phycisphaerales bacterium]|nr:sugar-binding protein [Phycisphaerales bacterium]
MRHAPRRADSLLDTLEPRLLLAADPITPDHPIWFIPRGEAVIDGLLSEADWDSAYLITRTQATRPDSAIAIRLMFNDSGLFLSADVQDQNLWADGIGAGAGNRWETDQDDSLAVYFDPDSSRDEFFAATDRALAVNIANPFEPLTGAGPVRRWKFVQGDGAGGAPDVLPGGALPGGAAYFTTRAGTPNDNSDIDAGWVTEMFIPWSALGMTAAGHGTTIGMNFDLIQDNDGGTRNLFDNRGGPERFTLPHFVDDHVQGAHSSYNSTQAGIRGPVNYAVAMFIDSRAGARPNTITNLSISGASPFGGRLDFTAPAGTTTGQGHVWRYEIRHSAAPIVTEAQWLSATPLANSYVPRQAGFQESLRVAGLTPSTTYNFAVRAVDFAGNLGALSNSVTLVTAPASGNPARIIPAPNGSGLIFESGEPFVAIGDHLGLSWGYTRQLFTGDVWDVQSGLFHNFSTHTPAEGPFPIYFDLLQAAGINTMRVYLELQGVHADSNPSLPNGTYWLENNAGQFNSNMQSFVHNVLREAGMRGIKLIFSPFDTFSYDEAFQIEGPWGTDFGGPVAGTRLFNGDLVLTDFFQEATLQLAKNRMATLVGWVNASPFASSLLGWEALSEWDSTEWVASPEGDFEPGRETEMRTRARWVDRLADYIKTIDPDHLVLNSTIVRDPRGPLAREIFYSRTFDALTPHLYTNSSEEPIHNPQADRKVMPAVENAMFTQYWMTHRLDNRPMLNGEWGMTRADWPGGLPRYSAAFTQQEDEAIFRTVIWSGLASGQFGTGLRIAADELATLMGLPNYFLLTPFMRIAQRTVSEFMRTGLTIDTANFTARTLAGQIGATAAGHRLHAWGVSDGEQGLAYVLRDGNVAPAPVTRARLVLRGLAGNRLVDAEIWSVADGETTPLATVNGVFSPAGELVLDLPSFADDLAIKFRARPAPGQTQGIVSITAGSNIVTFALRPDRQPIAQVVSTITGATSTQDVAAVANFRGRVVDFTPFTTGSGATLQTHLALTDERGHLWLITGSADSGAWRAVDLTALIDAPALTGDLTTYQPSWGAIHIAGLDARGHAINYWIVPGVTPTWQFNDLTEQFGGTPMAGGLTGYVTGWDGLNLAGVTADGEVIVYWWSPSVRDVFGEDKWLIQNMTSDFDGPRLRGQLDAYVTPWGGLNVAGIDDQGQTWAYWWAPGLNPEPNRWRVTNLSAEGGGPTIVQGTEVAVSTDGGINVLGLAANNKLSLLRWVPGGQWGSTDVTDATQGVKAEFPLGSASGGNHLIVAARGLPAARNLILFDFDIPSGAWNAIPTDIVVLG